MSKDSGKSATFRSPFSFDKQSKPNEGHGKAAADALSRLQEVSTLSTLSATDWIPPVFAISQVATETSKTLLSPTPTRMSGAAATFSSAQEGTTELPTDNPLDDLMDLEDLVDQSFDSSEDNPREQSPLAESAGTTENDPAAWVAQYKSEKRQSTLAGHPTSPLPAQSRVSVAADTALSILEGASKAKTTNYPDDSELDVFYRTSPTVGTCYEVDDPFYYPTSPSLGSGSFTSLESDTVTSLGGGTVRFRFRQADDRRRLVTGFTDALIRTPVISYQTIKDMGRKSDVVRFGKHSKTVSTASGESCTVKGYIRLAWTQLDDDNEVLSHGKDKKFLVVTGLQAANLYVPANW